MLQIITYIVFFFALVASIGYGLNAIKNIIVMSKMDESMLSLIASDSSLLKGYKVIVVCLLWTAYLILTNVL